MGIFDIGNNCQYFPGFPTKSTFFLLVFSLHYPHNGISDFCDLSIISFCSFYLFFYFSLVHRQYTINGSFIRSGASGFTGSWTHGIKQIFCRGLLLADRRKMQALWNVAHNFRRSDYLSIFPKAMGWTKSLTLVRSIKYLVLTLGLKLKPSHSFTARVLRCMVTKKHLNICCCLSIDYDN